MSPSRQNGLMMLRLVVVLMMHLTVTSTHPGATGHNMLLNPGFEDEDLGAWTNNGELVLNVSTEEKLEGNVSLLCMDRKSADSGPSQVVKGMKMGCGYELRAYVLLANDKPGPLGQPLKAVMSFSMESENDTITADDYDASNGSYVIASRTLVTTSQRWVLLTGIINAPVRHFSSAKLVIRGPDPEVDFYVDKVTLHEISGGANWLAQSHVMIDKHRKSDVTFRIFVPHNVEPHSVDVQVRLLRHRFAFGCKFEDKLMRKESQKYLDVFFNLFNWAALTDFDLSQKDKGKGKGKGKNKPSDSKPHYYNTLEIFEKQWMKVWAQPLIKDAKHGPSKDKGSPGEELPEPLQYMLNITKGKVEILDLQSKLLLGKWRKDLEDPKVTASLFNLVQSVDPKIRLFLNDFNSDDNIEDYHDLVRQFFKANTGIAGLGLKEHFKSYVSPDLIWRRLDRLHDTGLDLFISELDLSWPDDVKRADWFEDLMRAYFAHPAVQGVILSELWKKQKGDHKYMVQGQEFAEEGERFVCLTQKEWTTDQTFNLAYDTTFTMRGFQGDYEVIIRKYTVPMQREIFTLGRENMTVDIEVTEDSSAILTDEKRDFVPKCISHRNQKLLGTVTSASNDSTIVCSDHVTESSEATCPEGMAMTSCSSFKNVNGSLRWTGERITVVDGVATCAAVKQANNTLKGDIKIYARCCGGTSLECDYRQAGPSSPFDGAMVESTCPAGQTAMGCTAYNPNSHMKGTFPSLDMTSCLAKTGSPLSMDPALLTGVVSGVACCSRPTGIQCHRVKSQASDSSLTALVMCPIGDVMTGCNLEAEDGSEAGAHIVDGPDGTAYCKAEVGDHLRSPVKATAICCTP